MASRRFQVIWCGAAVGDLEQIVRQASADSPSAARRLLARIRERASRLTILPDRGRVVPELAGIGVRTYRELVSRPYRILYRRKGREVIVVAVLDGRRDLEDLLFERLIRPGA